MIINLPIPPSINAMYANARPGSKGRGRFKSKVYRDWLKAADGFLMTQKRSLARLTGNLEVIISLPAKLRGDISNRIKAAEDYLVSRELTGDDKHNWTVTAKRDPSIDCCQIEVRAA